VAAGGVSSATGTVPSCGGGGDGSRGEGDGGGSPGAVPASCVRVVAARGATGASRGASFFDLGAPPSRSGGNRRSRIFEARCSLGSSFRRIQSSGRTSPRNAIARTSRARKGPRTRPSRLTM